MGMFGIRCIFFMYIFVQRQVLQYIISVWEEQCSSTGMNFIEINAYTYVCSVLDEMDKGKYFCK